MSAEWMEQSWHHLLFLHWPLPPEEVRPFVPSPLELDLHDGHAYVGIVAFTMTGVRPRGFPKLPPLSSLHEVNVRTYVRRGETRGVWFFSLDAASPLAVAGARVGYGLPYFPATMRMGVCAPGARLVEYEGRMPEAVARGPATRLTYASQRWGGPLGHLALEWEPQGTPAPAEPGTLAHFLVERYTLFAERLRGTLFEATVRHPPYPIQGARLVRWEESLLAAASLPRPPREPIVHASPGVDVWVSTPRRLA